MPAIHFLYPANPSNVPDSITQPSAAFKKQVSGVMRSIIFFFIVYLLLFILSIGLVIGCVYAGIAFIINVPRLITIIAGLGLIGVGVMVFVFLVKFLFAVSKYDRSGIVEITEEEQPVLFAFIRQLAKDTQTAFPKKIYLSADVNACVFYDSSFWSMFLPVKKNLQIGLGLINALNVSEFKAVMAHEFGHFSQRSMKLGSFVYNVNKIIHNMLFDNQGFANFLQGWASLDGVFAFFASITAKIAQGIQWILRQMYGLINKNYMRLSREMEFHADAVATSVSGSRSLVTALRRVELANSGYNIALQKCDELFRQKKISSNIYRNQTTVLLHLAEEFKLPVQHGLPVVNDDFIQSNNLSRVNFKDQWASHPTTEDREDHLNQLAVEAEVLPDSAWVLFTNREELENNLTRKVYENVEMPADIVTMEGKEFEEKLRNDVQRYSLPDAYNGFYDNRQVAILENEEAIDLQVPGFAELFSAENASLSKKINAANNDLETLKAIADKRIDTKTFDFDGMKFKQNEALTAAGKLEQEIKDMQASLALLDKKAILFFYQRAQQKGNGAYEELKNRYVEYFELRKKADAFLKQVNEMLESLQLIFSGQTISIEEINRMIGDLKGNHEPAFKRNLNAWIELNAFTKEPETNKKIKSFISSSYAYFSGSSFFDNELLELNTISNQSWATVNDYLFEEFKSILELQLKYKNQ
ncbi:MAG: M48 family metalloprotease [Chitinophagaceae bacterium]|nr:M48 family metalloprotease [Chitinophagaceae bacterium]